MNTYARLRAWLMRSNPTEYPLRCCAKSATLFSEVLAANYGPENRAFLRIIYRPGKVRLMRITYCPFCGRRYR